MNIKDPQIQNSSDDEEVMSSSEEDMQKSGSESKSEEDSESESEEDMPVADKEIRNATVTVNTPVVKPAVSLSEKKHVAITTKNKEVPVASKSASKRPISEETSSPMKRAKNESGDVEIITGDDVKKSFVPTNIQLKKKISGLKKKYQNQKYKGDTDHDKKSMGLAERIWGPGGFLYDESANSVLKFNIGKSMKSEKKKVESSKPVEEDEEEKDVLVRAGAVMEQPTLGVKRD
ncbi:hypothetical protein AALP_AAs47157U000100, partial [Arabis alpina]